MKYFIIALALFISVGCGSASTDSSLTPAQQHVQDSIAAVRVGNGNTKVLHTLGCRYAQNLVNPVYFNSRDSALKLGYTVDMSKACYP
jgi:uncharacterized protein YcfL